MLLCLTYQFTIRLGIIAWYQVNKEYVAKVLCENKNKPEKKCCGKCYLNKQLKKTEDTNPTTKHLPNKIDKVEFSPFIATTFSVQIQNADAGPGIIEHHDHYRAPHGYLPVNNIFHPPSMV